VAGLYLRHLLTHLYNNLCNGITALQDKILQLATFALTVFYHFSQCLLQQLFTGLKYGLHIQR